LTSLSDKENVLLIGSGGREHVIAWKLLKSTHLGRLYVAPGNGGTADYNVPIKTDELERLVEFAKKENCFTIVGPEAPLAAGIVDRFVSEELPIFGPRRDQAGLETSKVFAKEFMKRAGIPTAEFQVFEEVQPALDYAAKSSYQIVVKADGLAAGKGVFVCSNQEEAETAIRFILEKKAFGSAGDRIVLEQKLEGHELSLIALCDGISAVPFGTAVDHKRALDGDKGPNTGGMGAFSPAETFDSKDVSGAIQNIVVPIVQATGFRGFLYVGLMLGEKNRPSVLEFNVRLGDPEAQVILPRLESDLLDCLSSSAHSSGVKGLDLKWSSETCCTVIMCSEGYPAAPRLGDEIFGLNEVASMSDIMVFHSGTAKRDGAYFTSGGRVLSVAALAGSKGEAVKRAYEGVNLINWQGEHHRKDVGKRPAS
jgi:phosphoribosylamine---glycine ligase